LTHGDRAEHAAEGTVLAVDYGELRLGVAVGELSLRIAHPLNTIHAGSDRERLDRLAPLIGEWKPVLMVVGLPVHMDGREHPLALRCRQFAQKLTRRFKLPLELIDERLTSYAAEQALKEAAVPVQRRKLALDQIAAQTILETYFQAHDHPA
jgi:putative Holliday junction resolvase